MKQENFILIIMGLIFVTLIFYCYKTLPKFSNQFLSNSIVKVNFTPSVIPIQKENTISPIILAKSAYLIDVDSDYSMYSKNELARLPIASLTKIISATVALEDYKSRLNDTVTITKGMINVEPSVINLGVGEKISVTNLLHGMLIASGNDAAYSLADYFDGREKFVEKMNQKVTQLGLKDTKFKDPAGLNDDGCSTANDLAIIMRHALTIPEFSQIISTQAETISSVDGSITHDLINTNKLLKNDNTSYYEFCLGGKTGFTESSGRVLIGVAQKDGHKLLSIILNANDISVSGAAIESKKLFEWGFDNFNWTK